MSAMKNYTAGRRYCASCHTGAGPDHASTARHRRATRSRETGAWFRSRAGGNAYVARMADPYGQNRDDADAYLIEQVETYPAVLQGEAA